jgi:hypothetical protein
VSLLGAEFYFEIHGILASPDVLGESLTLRRSGETWRIDLPSAPDSFQFTHVGTRVDDPRSYSPTVAVLRWSDSLVDIRLVRVMVNVESPLAAETYDDSDGLQRAAHHDLFFGLRQRAGDLVAELCERLRLDVGQDWIEPAGEYPRVVNLAGLVDIEAQQAFGGMYARAGRIHIVDDLLTPESLRDLQGKLRKGPLHADELLLAEAIYLVQAEQPVGPDRATLLAAIAVELRTKRLLQFLAEPDRVDMLDLLLDNPRDWSMSAHGLFHKAIPVMLRQEATEAHRALAKRVQHLFNVRNRLVHKGESVSGEDAKKYVQTARDVLTYMDSLTPTESDPADRRD